MALSMEEKQRLQDLARDLRLTVIDSSQEKTGCFYNPVGSVLAVSGGTLTASIDTVNMRPLSVDISYTYSGSVNNFAIVINTVYNYQ